MKITIIATGFLHRARRGAPRRRRAATQRPDTVRRAAAPAEDAAARPGTRLRRASLPGAKAVSPARTVRVKEPSLPLDEDQFDIPTFLRRQGQGDFQVGSPQTALLERYRYIRCRWLEPSSAANRKPRNTMTR